jgi:HEAT repeat protein
VDANELYQVIRRHPERITADYQGALAIFEAILEFNPALFDDLIRFVLETVVDTHRKESALSSLMLAARRKRAIIGPATIAFFKSAPTEAKRWLLPFVLAARGRDALRPALQFIATEPQHLDPQRGASRSLGLALHIDRKEDTIEFLASIPDVQPVEMLTARSVLLGPLDGLIWPRRKELELHCTQILKGAAEPEKIVESAIRVLVFLGDPAVCVLCEPMLPRTDSVGRLAALVPVLVPTLCDRGRYEAKVLDPTLRLEERATALLVLASVGADLSRIYRLVSAQRDSDANAQRLDSVFVLACAQTPFADAVPLVDELLKAAGDNVVPIVVAALTRLSDLPGHEITALFIRALTHGNAQIRQCAAIALSRRRSGVALDSLIAQHAKEEIAEVAVSLASAIAASGPRSAADVHSARHNGLGVELWQCIVATRLRDAAMADRLVEIATDSTLNWQLRRAAIFAAGHLPYEATLEKILPIVMEEWSPLTIDGSPNFQCHEVVANLLGMGDPGLMSIFARGRAKFVTFFGEIFDTNWQASMSREGLPPGADIAGWLFDRLALHGWPGKGDAPERVLNELHVPILQGAILRSLRLLGRPDLIEAQLPHTYHVWFAMKCLLERARTGERDQGLNARLKALVDASPCKGSALLYRVIDEFAASTPAAPATVLSPPASQPATAPAVSLLTYDEAVKALSGGSPDFKPATPLVLGPVTKEQLERLALMAEPENDRYHSVETYVPSVSFRPGGYVVAQRRVTTTGAETAGALIRPSIAAANRFPISIPWHQELLTGALATTYVPKLLASLGAQDDSTRFYEVLTQHPDVLLPRLCNEVQAAPVLKYIDARIVPFLQRYISSGTDEFFEGFCILARRVDGPEIDPILSGLLYRWAQRFDVRSLMPQHDQNHALWRGFKRLTEHPRFERIEGWQSRLISVLQVTLAWYRTQDIVRVLERDPRSYTLIEARLFRATNWYHFYQDEIDRLDAATERLFPELLER